MRLLNLKIRNFRGFGNTDADISLEGDLLIFYGPNGFGKTSLAEAIEWLFYGTTKRRLRGDNYSRSEYANSFANIHGGTPCEVTATVNVGDRHYVLTRRLTQNESSETFVEGIAASFASININPLEAVYPVVAQHGLQTFVHSKPKDRRDAICAALGLDELTALKNALDGARTSFQRAPPLAVTRARAELSANAGVLAEISGTQNLARRWRMSPLALDYDVDIEALLNAARSLTGVEVETVAAALDRLRERRQTASRSVFNADKLATNDAVLPSVLACFEALATELARVERAIADVVAAMAAAYSTGLLELWKKGLELSPTGDQCPMCEADTLTPAKRAELAERLNDNAARFAKSAELGTAINAAKGRVVELTSRLDEFGGARISADEADQLSNLFGDRGPDLATFNEKAETFTRLGATIREKLAAATTFLNRCAADLEQAENAPRVVADARTINENIQQQSAAAAGAFPEYTEAWQAFSPKLYVLISSTEFVARIDAVGKTLRTEPSMRVLDQYDKVLKETQVLIRAVEQEMQTRQEHLLTTRGAEVKDLYDRLNRGADVLFEEMEPGTDTMRLHATSFGTRMSAAANLSECQLNCLGLAMWLMRATTPASPFGFVLLDDPVQSMDDDHTEAFISDIVPHLLDGCGKQVIVLSHVKRIAERLRDLNTTRPTKLYHYESYDRAGPSITEQVALKMLVAEIKGASRGNEQNRKYSVDRIRVLVEHFVRELYLKVNGAPVPPKYDQATAKDLLPVFQTITGATPQEHAGLRDTVKFCDPAHHTEVGYAVPIQSNIQPHIDRLEGLIKKYGM